MFKKKWFWGVIVIALVVVLLIVLKPQQETEYVTQIAAKQSLQQTVEVTGSVESADDIDLNFRSTGIIQSVRAEVSDQVVAGQILANLRAANVSAQIADAQAAVMVAESDLEALLAGQSTEDVQITEEQVVVAEIAYQTAIDGLVNIENTRDQDLANLRSIGMNVASDKYFTAQYGLDIIEDAIIDSTADSYLYVTSQSIFSQARFQYQNAMIQYQDFLSILEYLDDDQEIILNTLDSLELTLEAAADALNLTFDTMLVTIENSVYTSSVISEFKLSINSQLTVVNTAITSVQTASANLRTQDIYYQNAITEANNSIQSAASSLRLAQAKLAAAVAPPRDFEITAAEARVRRAQASLARVFSDYNDTVIKAPVDGIITKVNFNAGENNSLATPVISMIGNSNLQIEVDVPESDVTKIEVGDHVDVVLDAFSSDDKFIAKVTFIDPAATSINDVIYYQVKVSLDDVDDRIKSGMTADLTIFTNQKNDVLAVPTRSLIYKEDGKYIKVLINEIEVVEKKITTGLKSDDGFIEILSGIEAGENVITFIKNGEK
ncbi:efflux RND transporter periplasmic adaptor subunit [bacterium]|jgi:RND family efflux transporter MFP subunit|nr:efflux RND transporter periplasmic adaptor subunit [bacterium]MBT4649434.1 efflux RND transporter periplasmic adaptor subunit [bacterium]